MNRIPADLTCFVTTSLVAIAASLPVGTAHAELYDATSEFNGTQGGTTGVWRYGSLDATGNNFTLGTLSGGLFNGASGSLVGGSFMHSGGYFTGVRANLRFIAPTAGVYNATFVAKLLDPANNPYVANLDYRRDGVRMWLGDGFFDLQTWDQATLAQSFEYQTVTRSFTLAAGETIDFSIDPNGARGFEYGAQPSYLGYGIYDSTAYSATVQLVPTPGGVALMCLAGAMHRRRRR